MSDSSGSNRNLPQGGTFESKLTQGRQRFLAHVIEHGFGIGRRTPEDFIRHFPPSAIMDGMRERPSLRANILVIATGVKTKIAIKKTAESAGLDLQIALDEGETDCETVVTLFDPDDRVRYLDQRALWRYITEGQFWLATSGDPAELSKAKEHTAFMLDRALKDELIAHRDIVEGIGVVRFAELLPRTALGDMIQAALQAGRGGKPFTEIDLIGATPPTVLVEHVPLSLLWDGVIAPKIAETQGFVDKGGAQATAPTASASSASREMMKPNGKSSSTVTAAVAPASAAKDEASKSGARPQQIASKKTVQQTHTSSPAKAQSRDALALDLEVDVDLGDEVPEDTQRRALDIDPNSEEPTGTNLQAASDKIPQAR